MKSFRAYSIQLLSFLLLGIILGLPGVLYAQSVDESELNKGQGGQVEFQNYTGPNTRVDTRTQIWNIGYPLGTAVRGGAARNGAQNRYFVIHSVTAGEEGKLDADIFGLGPAVGVDHIRNLRLIIQGYLEGAYNYTAQDASLLAEYITIYNAVFRGNWNYFTGAYKNPVIQNLTPERVGLSTRFTDWPGRTLILIPLENSTAGSLSAVDTSSLSGPSVIEEMRRTDEDEGAGRRTEMADLKDREADEAAEKARLLREAIAAEEAKIAAEQAALQAERERLARERDTLSAAELAAREAEAARRAKELADREAALAKEREAAQQAEDFAEQKRSEAEQDRASITGEDKTAAEAAAQAAADRAAAAQAAAEAAARAAQSAADQAQRTGDQGAAQAAADQAAAQAATARTAAAQAAQAAAEARTAADQAQTPTAQAAADRAAASAAAAQAAADRAAASATAAQAAADRVAAEGAAQSAADRAAQAQAQAEAAARTGQAAGAQAQTGTDRGAVQAAADQAAAQAAAARSAAAQAAQAAAEAQAAADKAQTPAAQAAADRAAAAAAAAQAAADQAAAAAAAAQAAADRIAANQAAQDAADRAAAAAAAAQAAADQAAAAADKAAADKAAQDAAQAAAQAAAAAAEAQDAADQAQTPEAQDAADRAAAAAADAQAAADKAAAAAATAQAASQAQSGGSEDEKGGFIVRQDGNALEIVGMRITNKNSPFGSIVRIDSTGKILKETVNTINIRTVTFINDKTIIALAKESQGGGAIHLVQINTDTLEITKKGNDDINSDSLIWVKGSNLYAIISSGGTPYIGRFDSDLTLQAQSSISIHPFAGINFQGDMLILTQRDDGGVLRLDPMDLTEKR